MAARKPFASSIPDIYEPYGLSSRRRRPSTGYYVIRNLLLVGAVAGGLVALYRNDVFRDWARQAGQEQRYLAAEQFLVGSPGWGTPRSMESVLKEGEESPPAATATATAEPVAAATTTAAPTPVATAETAEPAHASEPVAAAPAPEPPSRPEPRATQTDVAPPPLARAVVAPPVTHAAAAPPATHAAAPVARAAVPAAREVPAAPAPRAPVADHGRVKAIKVVLEEDEPAPPPRRTARAEAAAPEPARARPEPPHERPEPPPKPEKSNASEVHASDNPLLAAVRGAVRAHPAKSSVPAAR